MGGWRRGRITDSGLVPRRTRLYRFFVRLSPRAAEYDGACLVELFSCLLSSSSIWASRLLSLSSAEQPQVFCLSEAAASKYKIPLLVRNAQTISLLDRYRYHDINDIQDFLGNCQICLQSKWRLHKRPKERQQKILCVLIFSAECPVPSLRFCDLQKTLRAETWHTY